MKKLLCIILALSFMFSTTALSGCGNSEPDGTIIRICNCEDYIDESLLEEFTEETGIEVIYSTYGTNENLDNELVINPNSFDLVVPSEYMIQNLAAEGRLNKLDMSKVPNYKPSKYIDERLGNIKFEVKGGKYEGEQTTIDQYMVGYMWGTMGWVYNTDKVDKKDVQSWSGPFKNKDISGKITIKDSVRDSYLVGLAMSYKDRLENAKTTEEITTILNSVDQQSINLVKETLNSVKKDLYGFEVDSGKNDIVLGNIYAYVAWSGDAAYAIDVATGEVEDEDGTFVENTKNLSYYIPDEGSNIWFDGFCMPSGSTNYEAVYEFLNFISKPENVIRNMEYTGYTSLVASDEIFDDVVVSWFDESEDLEEGEGVSVNLGYFFGKDKDYTVTVSEEGLGRLIAQYPTEDIVKKCAVMNYFDGETLMLINEMWEGVKGETFDTWVLILFAVIILATAVIILAYRNRDKLKWLKPTRERKDYATRKGLEIIKKENV